MCRRVFGRKSNNNADSVLPLALFSVFVLMLAFGFVLDVSKNVYIKQGYKHIAQKSVQEAVKVIDSQGNILPDSPKRVVKAYIREREKSEFSVFNSGACNTIRRGYSVVEDNMIKQNVANRKTPFIVIKLKNNIRGTSPIVNGGYNYSATYVSEGGSDPILVSGKWVPGMKVVQAQIYDSTDNFLLNIAKVGSKDYSLACQYFNMNVSAVKFASNSDVKK